MRWFFLSSLRPVDKESPRGNVRGLINVVIPFDSSSLANFSVVVVLKSE